MTMVVENLNDMTVARNEHAVYVKDANVLLKLYRESVAIIDLTNTVQAGKTCKKYCFSFNDADNGYYGLYCFLDDLPFLEFVNNCRAGHYFRNSSRLELMGIRFNEYELKACRVISPFAAVKKQNFDKGVINGAKLAKAILAGQVKEIVCTGRYTDDYYDDAKRNFCKGRKVKDLLNLPMNLLRKLPALVLTVQMTRRLSPAAGAPGSVTKQF